MTISATAAPVRHLALIDGVACQTADAELLTTYLPCRVTCPSCLASSANRG